MHKTTRLPVADFPPHVRDRFLAKVPDLPDDVCWPWMAGKTGSGYGSFSVWDRDNKRYIVYVAHRVLYELTIGPIPDGRASGSGANTAPVSTPPTSSP
jgi:hypothetical protein